MNRRQAIKLTGLSMVWFCVFLTACGSVTQLLNVVLDAAAAILRVALPTEPWVTDLEAAIAALKKAEAAWSSGGAVDIVISALNTLEAVLAAIPLTAVYSPLIDVLVAGIEAVLVALLPTASATLKTAHDNLHDPHRHRTQLKKPGLFQTIQGAFREQWDQVATANPELIPAKI